MTHEQEVNPDTLGKKKKRYGKKRNKRSNETSSERNKRSRVSHTEKISENSIVKFPALLELNLDNVINNRISSLLSNVVKGNDNVHYTPICGSNGINVKRIMSQWDKIFTDNKHKMNGVLIQLEDSQRGKTGPRSVAIPWNQRKEDVLKGFINLEPKRSITDSLPSKRSDKGRLTPISLENSVSKLKSNTNSGLPFFVKKRLVKQLFNDEGFFKEILSRRDPCLCFTRTQEQNKTRLVWGFPIADTINEMLFYPPLLEYQKKLSWRSVLNGPEMVSKRITDIILNSIYRKRKLISIDFSAYDASINHKLQNYSFNYIKHLFQSKFKDNLDYIQERFGNIGLVTPDGVLHGRHGVPSGSVFTNEIDSIVQFLIARNSGLLEEDYFQVQGDDGVYSIREEDVSKFFKEFTDFGLIVNESKSVITDNYVLYLQNLYHVDYIKNGIISGIYPIYRALNRILYSERYIDIKSYGLDGSDYFTLRTISILENCKYHPLFEDFVKFIVKLDRNGLVPTQIGIDNYRKLNYDISSSEGIINNQLGSDVKGLKNFATFKLIMKINSKVLT